MLRYGFYDAMNGDRTYDAEDMGRLFDGIIRDGVIMYSGEHQEEDDGNPLPLSTIAVNTQQAYGVEVAPGRAWFNGTWTDLSRDTEGQSALFFQIEPNASAVTKYYFVVLVVDKRPLSSARQNTIMLVPNTPQHGLYNSDNVYTYVLSKVEVTSNGIGVTNYIGSNTFTFNSVSYKAAPFVTAPLQQLDIDQILAEWYFRALGMVDEAVADYFDGSTIVTSLGDIGGGRASCSTATASYYKFVDGGMLVVNFEHALVGNSALQINPGSGYLAAKKIFYHRSQSVEAGIVNDGTSVLMVYNASLDSGNGAFEIIVTDNISSSSGSSKPAEGWAETDLDASVQAKLNRIQNGYASCTTGAATATKQITINGYSEIAGSIVSIRFTYKVQVTQSITPTLSIRSSTGDSFPTGKGIRYNGSALADGVIPAGAVATFVYDGTYYNLIGIDLNGNGLAECTTVGSAKAVTISKFAAVAGSIIVVRFTNLVQAGDTLNVSSLGAKDIYHKNAAIAAGVINAGDTATFMYDGTRFHLLGTDAPPSSSGGNVDNVVIVPIENQKANLTPLIIYQNPNIMYYLVDPVTMALARLVNRPRSASDSSCTFMSVDVLNRQYVLYELPSSGSDSITMSTVPFGSVKPSGGWLQTDISKLTVTVSDATGGAGYVCDTYLEDILAANTAGKEIEIYYGTKKGHVLEIGATYVLFDVVVENNNSAKLLRFTISGSGAVANEHPLGGSGSGYTGPTITTPTQAQNGYVLKASGDGSTSWVSISTLLTAWTPSNPYGGV